MNDPIDSSKPSRPALHLVVSNAPFTRAPVPAPAPNRRPLGDLDPFTRGYRRFARQLRAACAQYVERCDIDDLVQDVWTIASRQPARLAQSDARTLSWLIGIAKRCAGTYEPDASRLVPLDELLAREGGDDLDGRAAYEDVEDARAARRANE